MVAMNEVNDFEGFEEHDRGRQLNWFRGFGEGMIEDANEGMNERTQVNATANEGARGGMNGAYERRREEVNEENVDERGGEGAKVRGGRARGRIFRGKRSRCRLCGATVSYANMARHERTHRVWDPGGGPHPA